MATLNAREYKQFEDIKHTVVNYTNQSSAEIGIIDVIIHTSIFPIVNKLPWDIFTQFKNNIVNNYQDIDLANIVLYLYASEQVLWQRKSNDVLRDRNAFESNIRLYPLQKKFYFMLANSYPNQVFCLDTDSNFTFLIKEILSILNQNASAPPLHLYDLLNLTDSFF